MTFLNTCCAECPHTVVFTTSCGQCFFVVTTCEVGLLIHISRIVCTNCINFCMWQNCILGIFKKLNTWISYNIGKSAKNPASIFRFFLCYSLFACFFIQHPFKKSSFPIDSLWHKSKHVQIIDNLSSGDNTPIEPLSKTCLANLSAIWINSICSLNGSSFGT